MISGRTNRRNTKKYKTFVLTGGLNEQITNLELKPGELIEGLNYLEQDDKYHGYESIKGYERFDGQAAPSSILLDDATPGAEVDTSREAQRDLITVVETSIGSHSGSVYGVHIYKDKTYAFRNVVGDLVGDVLVSGASGWSAVTGGTSLSPSGSVRAVNYSFSEFQQNSEVMFFVDGVSLGFWYYTGAGVVTQIEPDPSITDKPTHIGAWQNRLFVVYPNGHILFSEVGDPTGWDSDTGLAGEVFLGADVTGIKEAPGGVLAITTRDFTKVLHYGSTSNDFIFKMDDFSNSVGSINGTIKNLMGDLHFADDRGFTSFQATADSGGYSLTNISKNVYKTYIANRENITFGTVDRDTNRYYLFYDDPTATGSSGLVFTFLKGKLKGATKIQLNHTVTSVTEGKLTDGTNKVYFGASDGFVYQLISGTSFDGSVIPTNLTTSFYHYGSPRIWKRFIRLEFEISASTGTTFDYRPRFDYNTSQLKLAVQQEETSETSGGIYGVSLWGSTVWAGSDVIDVMPLYIQGYGTNMAVEVQTSSAYRDAHTIHNITTDYTVGNTRQ
ncbi:MAG: hypothetical protein KAS32_25195 [Candidatus Peribacteraceae bacterium]|nr:hypothetical protein [Candidatus Peribacteraceae bacterium]